MNLTNFQRTVVKILFAIAAVVFAGLMWAWLSEAVCIMEYGYGIGL